MPGVSPEVGKSLFPPPVNQGQREGQLLGQNFEPCDYAHHLNLCRPRHCFQQTRLRVGEARDGLEIAYLSFQADDSAMFTLYSLVIERPLFLFWF